MYKKKFLLIAVFCAFLSSAEAYNWQQYLPTKIDSEDGNHYGPLSSSHQSYNNVTIYGPANVTDCTFTGNTVVMGMLKATDSTFENLQVNGICDLKHTNISQALVLKGILTADNSVFDTIEASTSAITLKNSRAESILLNENGMIPQYVYLKKKSVINGDIVFKKAGGTVVSTSDSQILGKVIGGNLIVK